MTSPAPTADDVAEPRWAGGHRRVLAGAVVAAVLAAGAAAYAYAHVAAAFTLPVPWGDEAVFLWQAITFQKAGTLAAPQVNPFRPVLWMPPGYMIALGTLFKLTGFSFVLARGVSLVCMLGVFGLLFALAAAYGRALISAVLIALFMLSPGLVVAGNVVRMEAMLLLVVCLAFLLLQKRCPYTGMALLGLSPLIHPNGLFFALGGLAFVLICRKRVVPRWRPGKLDLLFLAAVTVAWALYLVYVVQHWDAFVPDMAWQFGRRSQRGYLTLIGTRRDLAVLAFTGLCTVYAAVRRLHVVNLLFLGLPAFVAAAIGQEMWYTNLASVFYLILGIVAVHVLADAGGRLRALRGRYAQPACAAVILACVVGGLWRVDEMEGLTSFPSRLTWCHMGMSDGPPYVSREDISILRSRLRAAEPGAGRKPLKVQFCPTADALFVHDLDGPSLRLVSPVFHDEKPDAYVIHVSRYKAAWTDAAVATAFREAGIKSGDGSALFHRRDGTEEWYFKIVGRGR